MTEKSKLGRNPFTTKKIQPKFASKTHAFHSRGNYSFFSQTLRWIFFDAPIGICFLACQACFKPFRVKGKN